ncbi:GNAT family N-acetyltransferase [Amycolatopsis dongchuanensis]|uniref:Acetyltransferase (GNAT) family protein n=2 Tax=Amycolatopsis TaxID=1813 RepID=A0A1I3X4X9_9PSEU|nr:Acetyltransferase (GNAT) family protein [Amycolatopsis sacchari]
MWELVTKFAVSYIPDRTRFDAAFARVTQHDDMLAATAIDGERFIGYLLANRHPTFFANGPVVWVEEVMVEEGQRGRGAGRELMRFAEAWAEESGAAYIALATRRAAGFYTALGYAESAAFFRKKMSG